MRIYERTIEGLAKVLLVVMPERWLRKMTGTRRFDIRITDMNDPERVRILRNLPEHLVDKVLDAAATRGEHIEFLRWY